MTLAAGRVSAIQLPAPAWVHQLMRGGDKVDHDWPEGLLQVTRNDSYTLVSIQLDDAAGLDRDALGARVHGAYLRIAEIFSAGDCPHPVRFWNHIPQIHADMGAGLDRYMAFNVGRHQAFCDWYGGEKEFGRCIATASGVGCRGGSVVIHALAADRTGIAVANPRQVQPFQYSKRFGPRPPCFARATVLPRDMKAPLVLVGGTASIRGEESVYVGDLQGQLKETFTNLSALLDHCTEAAGRPCSLQSLTDLRVYVVDPATTRQIDQVIRVAMPHARRVELLQADLCRSELLVEIEGIAEP
jgi:enamine deaminase RidA (YjgF/YER057c/UK114 family)